MLLANCIDFGPNAKKIDALKIHGRREREGRGGGSPRFVFALVECESNYNVVSINPERSNSRVKVERFVLVSFLFLFRDGGKHAFPM